MITRLYIVRHGVVEADGLFYGQLDVPLSDEGRLQARQAAGALEPVDLAGIYCSDLERARFGARAVAAGRAISPAVDPAFREMNLGILEGVPWKELASRHPEYAGKRYADMVDFAFPEGETLRQVEARVDAALRPLLDRHAGQTLALVAHNSVNRILLGRALGLPLEQVFGFKQDFGCINLIDYAERPRVSLLNWTPRAPLPIVSPDPNA